MNRYSEIIRLVAENHGQTYEHVRQEIAEAIHSATTNPDELARQRFKHVFGDKEPSPEEFLETISQILGDMM